MATFDTSHNQGTNFEDLLKQVSNSSPQVVESQDEAKDETVNESPPVQEPEEVDDIDIDFEKTSEPKKESAPVEEEEAQKNVTAPTFPTAAPEPQETPAPAAPAPMDFSSLTPEQIQQMMSFLQQASQKHEEDADEEEPEEKEEVVTPSVPSPVLTTNAPKNGWRGMLARIGIPVEKSKDEKEFDQLFHNISREFDTCRIVGSGSLKGGSGKTTAASVMAAVTASTNREAKVAALDLDPTGTLKFRAMDSQPTDVQALAEHIRKGSKKMSAFAAHTRDGVDIFGSRKSISSNSLTADDVDVVVTALREYYDFVFIDMPIYNDTEAYERTLRHLDALVYAVSPTSESVAQMSEYVQMLHHRNADRLLENSLIVFNNAIYLPFSVDDSYAMTLAKDMQEEGVRVVQLPFDRSLFDVQDLMLSNLNKDSYRQCVRMTSFVFDIWNSQE